jgi:hypothetical protein
MCDERTEAHPARHGRGADARLCRDSYDYDDAQVIVARIVEQLERTTPP